MAIQLDIVWEGDAPGLQDHRLSLAAFGPALNSLLAAVRRIATNIVGNAVEGEASQTGRFAKSAKLLDIQIEGIKHGSSGVAAVVTLQAPHGETMRLFDELPETAGTQLLEAVDAECKGILKNSSVRRYLRDLPQGVYRQIYVLRHDERELRRVEIGSMSISDIIVDLPHIAELRGNVVGVGFEPGKTEVRIRTNDGRSLTLAASASHVDRALDFRSSPVMLLVLIQDSGSRLLRLQGDGDSWSSPSRDDALFKKWDGLLQRLAQ